MKVIRDTIHGDVELEPCEMQLIHTREFQRLHGCRQLGLTHLVYPSAKHSRFEHVLGVMHVATQIADRLREKKEFFPKTKEGDHLRSVLRFGALLHDMGHVPFGHTLEDEMPVISKHDKPSDEKGSSRMDDEIARALRQSGNESLLEPVLQVLRAIDASKDDETLYTLVDEGKIKQDYLVLADIIGNTVCADLFDYIRRDHMMTGIRATYDERIFRYFGVGEHRFRKKDPKTGETQETSYRRVVINLISNSRFRNDALADLLDILKLRYNLSDKVLFHPQKCSADAMLISVVGQLGLKAEDLLQYSDDGFLDHHRDHALIKMIRERTLFKPVFACGMDGISSFHTDFTKEELLRKLQTDHSLRKAIEASLEAEFDDLPRNASVLIFCPAPTMTLKPIRALVKWKDGTIRRLNEIKDDVGTAGQVALLQEIYPRLWKLYLFVHPNYRVRGHKIAGKFLEILESKANVRATCEPALRQYLETGCEDYWYGRLLEQRLQITPEYSELSQDRRKKVVDECYAGLRLHLRSSTDDRFADLDVRTMEQRDEESALNFVVPLIHAAIRKTESK